MSESTERAQLKHAVIGKLSSTESSSWDPLLKHQEQYIMMSLMDLVPADPQISDLA